MNTLLWPRYGIGQAIISLPRGFFFSFVLSFFFLFSSHNLSGRRLDVYYTSTHGAALVPQCEFRMQIWNVLRAAAWKCRTQEIAINSPSGHHRTTWSAKDLLNSNVSCTCPHNMWISAYYRLRSVGEFEAACKFQRVSLLGSVTARHSSTGRQPNFAALNRGRHLYSAGRPSCWALGHISSLECNSMTYNHSKSHRPIPHFRDIE